MKTEEEIRKIVKDMNELHPDYYSIFDEILDLPSSLDEEDWVRFTFWIFINRLLYGMHWGKKYHG